MSENTQNLSSKHYNVQKGFFYRIKISNNRNSIKNKINFKHYVAKNKCFSKLRTIEKLHKSD